jgi:very-short-patch-repair endonuclease
MPSKLTLKDFISNSKKIHKNKYIYFKTIYKNSKREVIIICKKHGEFNQIPSVHMSGHGCKKCSNEKLSLLKRQSIDLFIKKSNKIHKNKYNYSKTDYKNNKTEILINCPIHNAFYQRPDMHLQGHGCKKCSIDNLSNFNKSNFYSFVKKSKRIHGNLYDYSLVKYIKSSMKVKIKCKKHGIFTQTPNSHLSNHGCPICKLSKGELEIIKFLELNHINYISQKTFDGCKDKIKLKFDFYIPSKNLLIEYDGKQHFKTCNVSGRHLTTNKELKEIQYRDKIRNKYAKRTGLKLFRIKYTKIKRISELLNKLFI